MVILLKKKSLKVVLYFTIKKNKKNPRVLAGIPINLLLATNNL